MFSHFSLYKFDISRNIPLPLQAASQMQEAVYTYAAISLNCKQITLKAILRFLSYNSRC